MPARNRKKSQICKQKFSRTAPSFFFTQSHQTCEMGNVQSNNYVFDQIIQVDPTARIIISRLLTAEARSHVSWTLGGFINPPFWGMHFPPRKGSRIESGGIVKLRQSWKHPYREVSLFNRATADGCWLLTERCHKSDPTPTEHILIESWAAAWIVNKNLPELRKIITYGSADYLNLRVLWIDVDCSNSRIDRL